VAHRGGDAARSEQDTTDYDCVNPPAASLREPISPQRSWRKLRLYQ